MDLTPAAKSLYDWVDKRLGELKNMEQALLTCGLLQENG